VVDHPEELVSVREGVVRSADALHVDSVGELLLERAKLDFEALARRLWRFDDERLRRRVCAPHLLPNYHVDPALRHRGVRPGLRLRRLTVGANWDVRVLIRYGANRQSSDRYAMTLDSAGPRTRNILEALRICAQLQQKLPICLRTRSRPACAFRSCDLSRWDQRPWCTPQDRSLAVRQRGMASSQGQSQPTAVRTTKLISTVASASNALIDRFSDILDIAGPNNKDKFVTAAETYQIDVHAAAMVGQPFSHAFTDDDRFVQRMTCFP